MVVKQNLRGYLLFIRVWVWGSNRILLNGFKKKVIHPPCHRMPPDDCNDLVSLRKLTHQHLTLAGIELVLGTRVTQANVRDKTLLTAAGETISYSILIVATGARVRPYFPCT